MFEASTVCQWPFKKEIDCAENGFGQTNKPKNSEETMLLEARKGLAKWCMSFSRSTTERS